MRAMSEVSDWADDAAHSLLEDAVARGMNADDVVTGVTLLYRRLLAAYPHAGSLREIVARAEAAAQPPLEAGA